MKNVTLLDFGNYDIVTKNFQFICHLIRKFSDSDKLEHKEFSIWLDSKLNNFSIYSDSYDKFLSEVKAVRKITDALCDYPGIKVFYENMRVRKIDNIKKEIFRIEFDKFRCSYLTDISCLTIKFSGAKDG